MKRYLLCFILLAIGSVGCKKDKKSDSTTPSNKTYHVVFNVSQPQTSGSNNLSNNSLKTNAAEPVANGASKLFYLVYNSRNLLVHKLVQDANVGNFGTVEDELPAGTYTVYICAGQNGLDLDLSTDFGASPHFSYPLLSTPATAPVWGDTFFKKLTVNVSNTDINQSVTLERIVGQLQINIEDALPANASKFVVKIVSESRYFEFLNNKKTGPVAYNITNLVPAAAAGTANYKITTLIGNTELPLSINLICYDAANKSLADITISNVSCSNNVKTVVSGKLFESGTGFNIGLNNTWDPTPYATIGF